MIGRRIYSLYSFSLETIRRRTKAEKHQSRDRMKNLENKKEHD